MDCPEQKLALDCDFGFGNKVLSNGFTSNSIIYHPSNGILNYILLDLVKDAILTENSCVLVIAPSEYAVKQNTQYLKRHILSATVGSFEDVKTNVLCPKVIVTKIAGLHDLDFAELNSKMQLIIVLDCLDAMQNESLIKFVADIKAMKSEQQPRWQCFTSCVVPDDCDPDRISHHVHQLEEFYDCKLISLCDQVSNQGIFSAPVQNLDVFETPDILNQSCMDALRILNTAKDLCSNFHFQFSDKFSQISDLSCYDFVKDILTEIEHKMKELGEYGGSIAALAAFRPLVRLYTFSDSSPGSSVKLMLSHLVCTLTKIRKVLEDDMFRVQVCERAERFSSKKVQLLLDHLKEMPRSHKALIIVNDPNTASILTLILQKVVTLGKWHTHIEPGLMMNSSYDPLSDSWEDILAWERNMEVYSRFISGKTNTVILSGHPQGFDLPRCELVIVWDKIEKFSQLLQVKCYVHADTRKLNLFIGKTALASYENDIRKLNTMETRLRKILSGPLSGNKEDCDHKHSFRTPSGIEIKADSLISVLNWYCKKLPLDKFTSCLPQWEIEKCSSSPPCYRVSLYLPRVSPINYVKSNDMTSLQAAQQNAALKACQELYQLGELTDSMLELCDRTFSNDAVLKDTSPFTSDNQTNFESQLGLHNLRCTNGGKTVCYSEDGDILCDITYPQSLTSAQPRPNVETYVHKLYIAPISEPPPPGDNRKTVLYELLCDKSSFAILSSKPLPEVCQFPVFLFGHELSVKIETITSKLILDQNEIVRLMNFHCGLFMNILPITQHFMQFDRSNEQNSYLIAPLTADGDINWSVVDNHYSIPKSHEFSREEKMSLICTPDTHERTMVKPWYRYLSSDQIYLVSKVCTDMCADSCFPTDDFDTFAEYYMGKYNIHLERPELPMLEAYLVNTKVNGLLPRSRTAKMRREEKMEDFREHMVPELCMPLLFPASLWLKLSSLPTVLHRLHRILVVEDFRKLIVNEAGVGALNIDLQNLTVDKSCLKDGPCAPKVPPSLVKRGLAIGNVKLEGRKKRAQLKKPWQDTQEPVDIYRQMESLNFVEIRYFDEYLFKSSQLSSSFSNVAASVPPEDIECFESDNDSCSSESFVGNDLNPLRQEDLSESISLLKPCNSENNYGPQQHELLAVFTSPSSNDAVSMERIQVLGNSILNVIISVFTYQYGLRCAGSCVLNCLQNVREAFMNRNFLEMCSIRRQLCNRIKVLDFAPGEWIPPSFSTPSMLKMVLKEQEISPNVLQQIQLTKEEQLNGFIDEDSEDTILEVLSTFVNRGSARREEGYIDRLHVPRQTAASSLEALIGTYFKSCGWRGALKVVGWLQLLPSKKLEDLLDYKEPRDCVTVASDLNKLLVSLQSLELDLHYSFKDKRLLLQSVTHASYINPSLQDCMDFLAFIGSSVLDFVLTCYIYEHFTELTPSQMWRLRDFLSNSSTLAYFAVRHNIHKYLLSSSTTLLGAVDRFVKLQKGCQQPINDEVQLLFEEHECESALEVEVPDSLAKLLPSLVGAVYIDSGKNLSTVWDVVKRIFLPELGTWRQDVPLSAVELLKDLSPAAHQVIFSSKTEEDGSVEVVCRILMDNTRQEVFVAHGVEESRTKTHAAKLALRNLLESNFCY